ncbi:hypothetical protein BV510_22590 [Mycolicibacterium diernhoferi]|uniref:Uncharacterized protein n=1 Tax=Mycolicibacterium diernhoferi TaxID=1801 RepID=A0A1T3W4D5_9MYCO|nr:hypothetical protein BV510_22590 [Mycolicibacterium diernhoferi]
MQHGGGAGTGAAATAGLAPALAPVTRNVAAGTATAAKIADPRRLALVNFCLLTESHHIHGSVG